MKNNIDSLVIDLPCLPEINGEFETSKNERLALYDIIITAFSYKYEYEKAKEQRKEFLFKNQNLNDMKVYSFFLNKINTSIRDKFLRQYVLDTIKNLRANKYNNKHVKKTYETISKWFDPEMGNYGKIFRNNLATGSDHASIDFRTIFAVCDKVDITEDAECFKEVKQLYEIYKQNYEDLIK